MKLSKIITPAALLLTVASYGQKSFTDYNSMAYMHETSQPVYFNNTVKPTNKLLVPQVNCLVKKMGQQVNGEFTDYTPVLSADQKTLMFTSRRPGNIGHKKNIDNSWKTEDIWYTTMNSNGSWNTADRLPGEINTSKNEAITSLSADGSRMLICRNEDIFESELISGNWSKPHPIAAINSDYRETHASYADNGKTIYFTTNNPEIATVGGLDICKITKNANGSWNTPLIVENINSTLNEDDPTLSEDGKTFYFSSQGFNTFGGYDIFKSTLNNGSFTQPENLGMPVNSAANEPFISIVDNGKKALFSSDRGDTNGVQSIYSVVFLDMIKVPYTVKLVNAKTNQPVAGTLNVTGVESTNIGSINNNSFELIDLGINRQYTMEASAQGFDAANVTLSTPNYDQFSADSSYTMVVYLNPAEVKQPKNKVVGTINFDYNKSNLKNESMDMISYIKEELTSNPQAKLSINAHTDNVGPSDGNYTLSVARANAIVKFLTVNGIDASRLLPVGYGEERPLVKNDSDSNRAKNRRAEIELVYQ